MCVCVCVGLDWALVYSTRRFALFFLPPSRQAVKKALVRLHSQNRVSLPDRFLDLLGLNPDAPTTTTTTLARMRIGSKSSDDDDRQRQRRGEEDEEEDEGGGNSNKNDSEGPAERSQLNAELYKPVSAPPMTAQKGNENEDGDNTNATAKQSGD